jgi:hypothetical protein
VRINPRTRLFRVGRMSQESPVRPEELHTARFRRCARRLIATSCTRLGADCCRQYARAVGRGALRSWESRAIDSERSRLTSRPDMKIIRRSREIASDLAARTRYELPRGRPARMAGLPWPVPSSHFNRSRGTGRAASHPKELSRTISSHRPPPEHDLRAGQSWQSGGMIGRLVVFDELGVDCARNSALRKERSDPWSHRR